MIATPPKQARRLAVRHGDESGGKSRPRARIASPGRSASLPDDSAVVAAYRAARLAGEYGAKSRAARALGCSSQHVCNVLLRHRPRTSWEYEPCPGELEQQTRLAALYAAERARIEAACADPLLQRLVLETFNAVSTQPAAPSSESFINAPSVYVPPYNPVRNARAAADLALGLMAGAIVVYVTVAALSVWPLMLALWPWVLVSCRVAARQGRTVRTLQQLQSNADLLL